MQHFKLSILVTVVLMAFQWRSAPAFFRRPLETVDPAITL